MGPRAAGGRALGLIRLLAALCLLAPVHAGVPRSDPGRALHPGFEHFYNLDYAAAGAAFEALIREQPDSPDGYNHLAQNILYRHLFLTGALESELVSGSNPFLRRPESQPAPGEQRRFEQAIARSIALCDQRLIKAPADTDALYALGVAYGLRANYNFLVRKAWLDSLRDATKARKTHNRVTELDPGRVDARLIQGVHDYVVGSLPWTWKFLGFLVGFHGDKETGIAAIREVAARGQANRYDAAILLATIYRREQQPARALPLLEGLAARFPRNFLLRLEIAQAASEAGNQELALGVLEDLETLKLCEPPSLERLPLERIWYARGSVLFRHGEYALSAEALEKATHGADFLPDHIAATAWLRLGKARDSLRQRAKALEAYRRAIAEVPHSDAAEEARRYTDSPYRGRARQ